jgi:hypothetical protein
MGFFDFLGGGKAPTIPAPTDYLQPGKKGGLSMAAKKAKQVGRYYKTALPSTMATMSEYGPAFMGQGFEFGKQGVTGFKGLRDLATAGEAKTMADLRAEELGLATGQAGNVRGLLEAMSPEQAAQVRSMQDLAAQAAGAEGAYAGRMGEALGMYGIKPQTFTPTIQSAQQDAEIANQMAQEAYARRGALSPEEQRAAQQAAREAGQASGRLGGTSAIAAEIQNREAAMAARRAEAAQTGQQAFEQRQNLANLRLQEQQALFGQRVSGAQATAEMQQAGLSQLQEIEQMRANLRAQAGEEAGRAYGAAGGFYTQPGLEMLRQTPAAYTAGTTLAGMGLNLGQTMTPQLDYNLGLNLSREAASALDQRNLAQYQADMQAKAAQQQMFGDILGTAASAAMMFSDRRLKTDIKRVGTTDGGLPVYTYKYKGESVTQMGVMAQDVEKVNPEAVKEFGGYKAVNYSLVH